MLYLNLMGGLGNQLFQIFALINLSFELKIPFKLPINKYDNVSPLDNESRRPTYCKSIFIILDRFVIQFEEPYITIKENHDSTYYDLAKLPLEPNKNYKLNGYFQSEKYFIKNYENIKRLIGIDKVQENLKNEYKELLEDSTSLHFRIGDYVIKPDCHPILSIEYYVKAINKIQQLERIKKIIYFFEINNKDIINSNIEYLKTMYSDIEFISCPNNLEDWQQLLLMSCCKNNIIANSTFSWWGAYLNNNNSKIICYPSVWFGKAIKKQTKDLFPESWLII